MIRGCIPIAIPEHGTADKDNVLYVWRSPHRQIDCPLFSLNGEEGQRRLWSTFHDSDAPWPFSSSKLKHSGFAVLPIAIVAIQAMWVIAKHADGSGGYKGK